MSNCDGKGAAALSIAEHSLSTYSEVAEGYFGALPDKCGAWWTIGENAITGGLLSSHQTANEMVDSVTNKERLQCRVCRLLWNT